jgi:hypothetical protein
MAALQSKNSKNLNIDHQFRKSGTLHPSVNYPWNPTIQKAKNEPDKLNKKGNYKIIINKIIKTYGDKLDSPVELIKINKFK